MFDITCNLFGILIFCDDKKKKLMVAWCVHFEISMWMKVQDILKNYNRYSKILDCTISDQKKIQYF